MLIQRNGHSNSKNYINQARKTKEEPDKVDEYKEKQRKLKEAGKLVERRWRYGHFRRLDKNIDHDGHLL